MLARSDVVDRSLRLIETLSGTIALHIRGPRTAGARLFDIASRIHNGVGGASLVINDRVDVALALAGTGVHLRAGSLPPDAARRLLGPERPIGLSVRADDAEAPTPRSIDYLIAGTAFPTASHPGGDTAGAQGIGRVAKANQVPVLAIGGISAARIGVLVSFGIYGVAVIRAVWSDPDPVRAATEILAALDGVFDPGEPR